MKRYEIFIDENLPHQIAEGLNLLQSPLNKKEEIEVTVHSIKVEYGKGAKDEDWIPQVGKRKGIVITQDSRIESLKHQRELYKKHGVGMLYIHPPSKHGFRYWEMVKLLVDRWEEIKSIIRKNKTPFAFRATAKKKFEEL